MKMDDKRSFFAEKKFTSAKYIKLVAQREQAFLQMYVRQRLSHRNHINYGDNVHV